MKQIRNGIFETNSSSTHTLTIKQWERNDDQNIPLDSQEIFMIDWPKLKEARYGDDFEVTFDSQVGKASFILAMIADIIRWGNEEIFDSYSNEKKDDKVYVQNYIDSVMNNKLFNWLKEATYDWTGTHVDFVRPSHEEIVSSWGDFENYSDDELSNSDQLSANSESSFKRRVTEIIFDSTFAIEYKNGDW